jgi:hypothetical protein
MYLTKREADIQQRTFKKDYESHWEISQTPACCVIYAAGIEVRTGGGSLIGSVVVSVRSYYEGSYSPPFYDRFTLELRLGVDHGPHVERPDERLVFTRPAGSVEDLAIFVTGNHALCQLIQDGIVPNWQNHSPREVPLMLAELATELLKLRPRLYDEVAQRERLEQLR